MDKFIKHVLPALDAPGIEVLNSNGTNIVSARAALRVKVTEYPYSRHFTTAQTMTSLGLVTACFQGGPSSLDGVNKMYLEVEGKLNFKALSSELKQICGVQTAVYSTHVANAEVASWQDNQTALLVNCLRYAILAKLGEANGAEGMRGTLPEYNDGHVAIDRNQVWPADYREAANEPWSWPGGNEDNSYPAYGLVNTVLPNNLHDIISLRGMDTASSRFILAMLGQWRRTTRHALDFDTPMLINNINYRRETEVDMLQWIAPEHGVAAVVPPTLSSGAAMTATRRYVAANRLFSNFSDALAVVSELWYQYVPDTAEGNAWLRTERAVVLPTFAASRARYQFLVEGEGALLSPRALDEYYFLGDKIERLALYAMLKAMAAPVGLYARAVRRQNEEMPTDVLTSEEYIIRPETQLTAAVSEALRCGVPRTGVTGAYCYYTNVSDGVFSEPLELRVEVVGDVGGYDLVDRAEGQYLVVTVLPPPGLPILAMPLPMFGNDGPWALKGTISFTGSKDRHGAPATMEEAHAYAWLARLCGEDVSIRGATTVNAKRFSASNETQFVYTLMSTQEDRLDRYKVTDKRIREHHFIPLPDVHTKMSNDKIEYNMSLLTASVSRTRDDMKYRVCEFGGHAAPPALGEITVDVSSAVRKLRGYIQRDQSGFHEAEVVTAAVIPPPEE